MVLDLHMSKRGVPQPQGIADHRQRAEAHRRGRDHGAQEEAEHGVENTRGDGNPERVVDKREEEMLADVAHRAAAQETRLGDAAQITLAAPKRNRVSGSETAFV